MDISYKKGASVYSGYWNTIKANPLVLITFKIDDIYQPKLAKALKKRKLHDVKFRRAFPSARLGFYYSKHELKVILLLDGTKTSMLLN